MSDSDEDKPKTRERKPSMVKFDSNPVETGEVTKVTIKVENLTNAKLISKEQLVALVDYMSTNYEENIDRLAYLEEFKTPFLFDSVSLLKIMSVTTSVKTKLAFITMLGPRLTDPRAKSQELLDNFRFAEEKAKVEEVLKNRMNTIQSANFRVQSAKSPPGGRGLGRGGMGASRKDIGSIDAFASTESSPAGRGGRGGGQGARLLASPSSSDSLATPQNTPPPVPVTTPPSTTAPPPVPTTVTTPTPAITTSPTTNITATPNKSESTASYSSRRRTSGSGKGMGIGIGALMRNSFVHLTSPQHTAALPILQPSLTPPPIPTASLPTFDIPVANSHTDIPAEVIAPIEERRQSVVLKDFVFNENFESEKAGYVENWEKTAVKEANFIDDCRRNSLKILGLSSFDEAGLSEAWELKAIKVDDKRLVSVNTVSSEVKVIHNRPSSSSISNPGETFSTSSSSSSYAQNISPSDQTDMTSPTAGGTKQRRASYFDSRQFKGVMQDGQETSSQKPSAMQEGLRDKLVMAEAEDPIDKTADGTLLFSYNELIRRNFVKEYESLDKVNLEIHLTDDDFIVIFGTTREEFKCFPKWKQIQKKKDLLLF